MSILQGMPWQAARELQFLFIYNEPAEVSLPVQGLSFDAKISVRL